MLREEDIGERINNMRADKTVFKPEPLPDCPNRHCLTPGVQSNDSFLVAPWVTFIMRQFLFSNH